MTAGWVRDILARHGQRVTLEHGGAAEEVRAFLQPVSERSETDPTAVTGIGTVDGRLWLYLGQAALETGDRVHWEDRAFRVRSSRPYYIGETLVYWWASLEAAKEAAL